MKNRPAGESACPTGLQLLILQGGTDAFVCLRRLQAIFSQLGQQADTKSDNDFMAGESHADVSRITVLPGQRAGQPCIRGLRVTVWDVLDMLASGMNEDEIIQEYPYLEKADFPAVYAYASEIGRTRLSP